MGQGRGDKHKPLQWMLPVVGALVIGLAIFGIAVATDSNANQNGEDPEQGKVDMLARIEATQSQAVAEASLHPELLPTRSPGLPPPRSPAPWPMGLFQKVSPPFSEAAFNVTNEWEWDLNGNHVQVYAGSEGYEGADPARGGLVVTAMSPSLQGVPSLGGWYVAPAGTGELTILSYEGTVLTLQDNDGETFYFDAESRAFTDANGLPVPTDSPTPTPPPEPTPGGTLPFEFPTDTATPTPTPAPTLAAPTLAAGG